MTSITRAAANRLASIAAQVLPAHLSPWACAMTRELAEISGDRAALRFAAGCLYAACALMLAAGLAAVRDHILTSATFWSSPAMNYLLERPRLLGLLCGCAAVGLGLAYMAVGGAPRSHLLVNSGAMLLGAMMWLAFAKGAATRIIPTGTAVFVLALPLLATAFFGVAADGVSRWISVGPLSIQVSLVVLPMMIVLYALSPDRLGTAGMLIAAFALAAQPDRAMAGVLAAGLAGLVFAKPKRLPATALAAAIFAFAATLLLPDNSPAVPFVDRILYTAFAVHTLAGLAVAAGCALLLLPAFVVAMRSRSHWPIMLAFGASWAAVVAAAALGNYPTPLVGYGGSAVLGYLLSVALLPEVIGKAAYGRPSRDGSTLRREDGALKRRITRLA